MGAELVGAPETLLTVADVLFYRAVGGIAGAFFGLLLLWPRSYAGFAQRFVTSLGCAMIFSPILRWYFDWSGTTDNITAAACLIGMFSWWAAHAVIGLLQAGYIPLPFKGKFPPS